MLGSGFQTVGHDATVRRFNFAKVSHDNLVLRHYISLLFGQKISEGRFPYFL